MLTFLRIFTAFLAAGALLVSAQCLNQVAAYNKDIRTQTTNFTFFIVPVPKAAVQTALDQAFPLGGLSLLDVPTSDVFPEGFPADRHPVLVSIGLDSDIRMSILQIQGGLKAAGVFATYVKTRDGSGPIAAQLSGYISGEDGPLPRGLIPALASPLLFAGAPLRLGEFIPRKDAWQADGGGTLSAAVKWAFLPNEVSGPGGYPEAFNAIFRTTDSPRYEAKTFKSLINQPVFLPIGKCQRVAQYFNNATALPSFRTGQVTFGPAASGYGILSGVLQEASPDGSGVYEDVQGYSGCAQNIGYNPQHCDEAVRDVDPFALQ